MKLREWNARLHGLVIFRTLLEDPVIARLVDLTDRMEAGAPGCGGKPPGRREYFRFRPGSYMDNGCILGSAEPGRQPPQPEAAG